MTAWIRKRDFLVKQGVKHEQETAIKLFAFSFYTFLHRMQCNAMASENSQSLSLTGVGNARELGGYTTEDGRTVKRGVLLRTARISQATDEDKPIFGGKS